MKDVAGKIKNCGKFVVTADCVECGAKHFKTYFKCKNRWCLNCAYLRRLAWVGKTLERFIEKKNEGYNIVKINYTLKNMENLEEMLNMMRAYWRILNHDDKELRRKFKSRFIGGLRSIEIKRGSGSGLWHVHFHTLVLTNKEFEKDWDWLWPAWKKVTNGEGSIYVKGITGANEKIFKSVAECVKYIVKPEISLYRAPNDLRLVYNLTKGLRQINTWGCLRGLKKLVDVEEQKDEKELTSFICQLCGCEEYQIRTYLYNNIKKENVYDLIVL